MATPKFNTRAYNNIEILPMGVVKKSSNSDRLLDEIAYYDAIPSTSSVLFPKKIKHSLENNTHSLMLEFYPYRTLGDYIISDDEELDWDIVFRNINDAISLMKSHRDCDTATTHHAHSMYIQKTMQEYENLKSSYSDDMFSYPTIIINGKEYKNFETMWKSGIFPIINKALLRYIPTMIHGDMCFSNILYHPMIGPRFIDMRGSFGKKGIYGDPVYDLAKLLHSVDGGYEFIINDKFHSEKVREGEYNFQIQTTQNKTNAYSSYSRLFSDQNLNVVKLVQGLIFIGMCARHYDGFERQRVMYLTGIKQLNEILEVL